MYSADEARHFAQKYPGKMPTRMATGSARINSWCTPCSRVAQQMHPASLAGPTNPLIRATCSRPIWKNTAVRPCLRDILTIWAHVLGRVGTSGGLARPLRLHRLPFLEVGLQGAATVL